MLNKLLVKKILEFPLDYEWTLQGLGMLRLYLDDNHRMHIWDSKHRVENVSQMHTHPWDFKSTVIVGKVTNILYVVDNINGRIVNSQSIFCGVGGGLEGEPKKIGLDIYSKDEYTEGQSYSEFAHQIHVSNPEDGTVTIIKREYLDDSDHALVFWDEGEWVSAEPRPATEEEVLNITRRSLTTWFN